MALLRHHDVQPVLEVEGNILRIQERVTGMNLGKMLCSNRSKGFDLFDSSKNIKS